MTLPTAMCLAGIALAVSGLVSILLGQTLRDIDDLRDERRHRGDA